MPKTTVNSTETLKSIADRALVQMAHMIWEANHRADAVPTDPKVGGHPAACASSLHLATALHLVARQPQDFWCAKPHLAPLDHALHYQLDLFRRDSAPAGGVGSMPDSFASGNVEWMNADECEKVMHRLRSFSQHGEPVFQSYHAASDPDSWRILPSGTVGIPPVNAGYLALAHRYLVDRGLMESQKPHFWCLLGDSEFREGSLMEGITDFAERRLGEVTWILDYNRQSLDGTRFVNHVGLGGTDADRIEGTMLANGWKVLHLRHGHLRQKAFAQTGGAALQQALEHGLSDMEYQGLIWKRDAERTRKLLLKRAPKAKKALQNLADAELLALLEDVGGHDLELIIAAMEEARSATEPTMILAHTIKGLGLESRAKPGNHSALPTQEEVHRLLAEQGLTAEEPYQRLGNWQADGPEMEFLNQRSQYVRNGIEELSRTISANRQRIDEGIAQQLPMATDLGIDMSLLPIAHTQWMWGQIAGKLVRIGAHDEMTAVGLDPGRDLTDQEKPWSQVADLVLTLSPDVGTSTNINPTMDGKIYGPEFAKDVEMELDMSERGRPKLGPTEAAHARHIRFDISEQATMSATGSLGMSGTFFGVPLLPMMTVYDFFIKRALDQLYYNLYWRSGFLLMATPSGVSLAPEGAQHSWKSDIQMPSMVTWEPYYPQEMEWILCDTVRRHALGDNVDREGVLVRAVTIGVRPKTMLKHLRTQARYLDANGDPWADAQIMEETRQNVLAGGYWLLDHSNQPDYQLGDNVVRIFSMGAPTGSAVEAAQRLREVGIYADVLVVTSPELLLGRFAEREDFAQLKKLGLSADMHLTASLPITVDATDVRMLAARTVPIVSVVDGEAGMLDNAGSILATQQISLSVQKFSKSGTPKDIFAYHGIDAKGIFEASGKALAQTATRMVQVDSQTLQQLQQNGGQSSSNWRDLWPLEFE